MIVNGIIAEYNPFHNGHKYQLDQCREATNADYVIVVLSSNFTQRGEPAILDKFTRAKMALQNGADLVIELPISHSAASAEYFASGGVSILHQLGVVDYLCFGSECGDAAILDSFAQILLEEPVDFVRDLKSALAAGHSYPIARNRALMDYAPQLARHESVLSSPNNILGIEYCKALLKLKSPMKVHTIKRAGANYHDRMFDVDFCSALAIREALLSGADLSAISSQMPKKAYQTLRESLQEVPIVTLGDFSHMLLYKLLMEQAEGYDCYADVTSELSDRIRNCLKDYENYASFCNLLKTKNMTYARISRCLLHILLNEKKSELLEFGEGCLIPYARVLGFRKEATPLLSEIKKKSSIPLLTKLADAREELSPGTYELLCRDLRRGSIYECIAAEKAGRKVRDERQIPLVILD